RRHLRPEFLLVLGICKLEERERPPVADPVEGMHVGAHLAEELIRLAPGREQRQPDDVLVELAGLLLIPRDVGVVMQARRQLGELSHDTLLRFRSGSRTLLRTGAAWLPTGSRPGRTPRCRACWGGSWTRRSPTTCRPRRRRVGRASQSD